MFTSQNYHIKYKVLDFYSKFTDIFYAIKIEPYGYQ